MKHRSNKESLDEHRLVSSEQSASSANSPERADAGLQSQDNSHNGADPAPGDNRSITSLSSLEPDVADPAHYPVDSYYDKDQLTLPRPQDMSHAKSGNSFHSVTSLQQESIVPSNVSIASLVSLDSLNASEHSDVRANGINGRDISEKTTNASLLQLKSRLKIPISERRGLLSRFVLIPEYEDARDYSQRQKWILTFVVAAASITGPMGTSIILPAINDISESLNTTPATVNISVGVYILSLGIFPLWWSAFSELFGRRSVYIISFAMFVAFSIGTSLSPSIASLIILRIFQGGASASVQAVGAGTISDLFAPHERGKAMGYYYLGPLCGPLLSPIIGGALNIGWGWRATQWFLVIISGVNLILMILLLPETLRKKDNLAALQEMLRQQNGGGQDSLGDEKSDNSQEEPLVLDLDLERVATNLTRLSTRGSKHALNDEEEGPVMDPLYPTLSRAATNQTAYSRKVALELLNEELRRSRSQAATVNLLRRAKTAHWLYDMLIRPTHSILLLKYPPLLLAILYSGVNFAIMYFMQITISREYASAPYNFSSVIVGLMYIPNSLMYVLTSILGGRWNDHLLAKYMKNHNGEMTPDSRLSWNIVVASILYFPAMLIFGWTLRYGEFWFVPLIGLGLYGIAGMLIIGSTLTYIVDTLPGKGATGVALNNLIRQILAAVATFVTDPAIDGVGTGVLFSILLGVFVASSALIYALKKNGAYFRANYDVGRLYDKL